MSSEQGLICMCRVVYDHKYDDIRGDGGVMDFAV